MGTYWATKPNDWQSQILDESKTPRPNLLFFHSRTRHQQRTQHPRLTQKYSWDPKQIELSVKSPCLHPVFGPAFTSCPLFQWYLQSNEILLNLTKCTMFKSYCSSCIGRSWKYVYIVAVEALRQKERQYETPVYHQNWWKKLIWVSVISLCKIFIPSHAFHALLCGNWLFSAT